MASLFSVLKAKIKEIGFMTDTLIGQPNDKMTSYIHLHCISMMYSLHTEWGKIRFTVVNT